MKQNNMPSHHGVKTETNDVGYPNETIKFLLERGSLRNFSDKKIEPEILDFILRAGVHSPTGGNLQPYSIIKIEDGNMKENIAKQCGQVFMARAPVHLLFCIDWHRVKRWAELEMAPFSATGSFRHFWISFQDTVICAHSICNAAESLGVGSVYIGTIIEFMPKLIEIFALPEGVFPVVLLCLGYPNVKPGIRKKLPPSVVVHNEKYKEMEDEELRNVFYEKYDGQKIEITDERMKLMEKVCREVHGGEFAEKVIDEIKEKGYINPVQRYFGLHYSANEMPEGNEIFLDIFEKAGFSWFKDFKFSEK